MRVLNHQPDQRVLDALATSPIVADLLERHEADVLAQRRILAAEIDRVRAIAADEAKVTAEAVTAAKVRLERAEDELKAAKLENARAASLDTSAAREATARQLEQKLRQLAEPEIFELRRELVDLEAAGRGDRVTEWSPGPYSEAPNRALVARPIKSWAREIVKRDRHNLTTERRWEGNGERVGRYVATLRSLIAQLDELETAVLPRPEILRRLDAIRRSIPSTNGLDRADKERAS